MTSHLILLTTNKFERNLHDIGPSIELKQKLKLLKCKTTIQIATLNIRTLNRIGQLPELTVAVIDHNIDIVCVREHRYHQSKEDMKYHNTGNGWTFVSSTTWKNFVNNVWRQID